MGPEVNFTMTDISAMAWAVNLFLKNGGLKQENILALCTL